MPPQKDEARCDLRVWNIFYQQVADTQGQNPGFGGRTPCNKCWCGYRYLMRSSGENCKLWVIQKQWIWTKKKNSKREVKQPDHCEIEISFGLIHEKMKLASNLIESRCSVLLICMPSRCGAIQETHGGMITAWDKLCAISYWSHVWAIKLFWINVLLGHDLGWWMFMCCVTSY